MSKILSTEDTNLNSSIRSARIRKYKDIDLSFEPNPNTKDIFKKNDVSAVKQSVKNLLLTNRFEKPFRPNFGGNLSNLLFELVDSFSDREARVQIQNAISLYEPRALVLEVSVNPSPDNNLIKVKVVFQVINTEEIVSLETSVSRLR